ncbi:AfsR/SARP family transcriptional regulator [Streptomyces spiramenti]|uniref:AfsR/SARP family transcriptional regulator n=1 Tax=Streptomyces spiramenti TaxID=2720606 RepID=A0ABX1AE51_9ACTN|nr:AfsR/SARP family transcriptional regulator [Streptomyces spiramenti]NJP65499.1 AfsR/SARP family transcriptional regulator [Streptomyces spiramenti]
MDFGVLGPLSVRDEGIDRTPTAPKQRQMLALLLMNANHVVSMSQFVEELWEYSPPSSAVAAVHTYVMQLRRTLGDRSGTGASGQSRPGRLTTRDHGYALQVRPAELDLDVYEDEVRRARNALEHGALSRGVRELRAAQQRWRGQILVDVPTGPLLHAGIAVVERNRLDAVSRRISAELDLGRHHALIGELSSLSHAHPADEDLAAQLMLALYRSGRRADALAVFHRLRYALRDEHGASPSAPIQQLNTDVLAAHPRLESPSTPQWRLSLDLLAPYPVAQGAARYRPAAGLRGRARVRA